MNEPMIKIELAGYGFSVNELKNFLETIAATDGFWANHPIQIADDEDWYTLSAVSSDDSADD